MARTKGAKNVVKQAEQPKNDSSKTKGKAINEQEVVTSVTRDKGKKIVGRSVPIVSEAGNLMVVGEPSQRSIELRTKHRNDPLLADFKKAMIEGVSRKRKVNGSTKQNVGVVIGGGEDIPAHDVLENPAAAKKKTRHEKRKEALVNYKQVVVKPASAYASLFTRTTSCALFKAIGQMNDLQQYSVGRLGFDEILELTIKDIPGRLSYFVLDSFDRRRCDITLPNGQTIPVTEDDVHRVLGFPKGFKKIKLIDSTQTTPLCEEWKQCFPNTHPKKIKITEVKDAMLAHEDGSKWFKIHFMVMLTHCLIESTSNGCVFPRMIKCLEDLNSVSQWNWCEFVIRSLIENHVDWENDTATTFVGPTLFLTVFYVDRVRWANSDIRRDFPLIKNWSTKLLKKRENAEIAANGFGVGVVVGPIDVETAIARAAKQKEIGDDGEGAPVDESLAMKITHFKIARDALITVVNAAVPQDPESNTLEFEEAKRLLLSAPIVSTSLPVEKIKEGSNGVNVNHMMPEKTTNIGEGADHMTPENPADVLEDYCLGMTQLGNEAMTSNTVTGDGNVGINTETEYHFQDSGAVDVVRDTTSLDDAVGLKDAMPTVELPIKGTAAGKITGENAEDLGCQMDVAATTEDFTFATTPQVGIIVEQPENVGVQGQRRARTNLTRVRLPTGKENVSFENPTVLVGGACVLSDPKKQMVLQPRDENVVSVQTSPLRIKCRGKEVLRKSTFNLSPYIERSVNSTKRLNKKEKALAMFALYNDAEEHEEVLFVWDDIMLQRMQFCTLRRNEVVGLDIINTWCLLLNWNEQFRSDNSPTRFFASTGVCLESTIQPPCGWAYNKRRDIFFRLFEAELLQLKDVYLANIDMFFLPICRVMKYHVICVDMRKERIYILDSQNETVDHCRDEKYSTTVDLVKNMLADYMAYAGQIHRSNIVKRCKLSVVHIKWGDFKNINDTGVYMMRHMETFMGESPSVWTCGLAPKLKKQLNLLRVRYCASLLGWDKNNIKDAVSVSANARFDTYFGDASVNIDAKLLG